MNLLGLPEDIQPAKYNVRITIVDEANPVGTKRVDKASDKSTKPNQKIYHVELNPPMLCHADASYSIRVQTKVKIPVTCFTVLKTEHNSQFL